MSSTRSFGTHRWYSLVTRLKAIIARAYETSQSVAGEEPVSRVFQMVAGLREFERFMSPAGLSKRLA